MNAVAENPVAELKKTAKKFAPPAAPAQENAPARYVMPVGWYDSVSMRLEHAYTVLGMLVSVFTGDDIEEPRSVPGLMGIVQLAKWLLGTLWVELSESQAALPDDLRWRTFEASELIDALEYIEFENGFRFNGFTDEFTCSYFGATREAVRLARAALNLVETK